jgi:hypothetical protein
MQLTFVKRPPAMVPRNRVGRHANNNHHSLFWCRVHDGAVGRWFSGRDARSAHARIRLLADPGNLDTARRIAPIVASYLLALSFVAAGAIGLHAQPQAASCHGTQQARQVAELLFGRDAGHKLAVSESAWRRFIAREITPRFPDGLTVSDAYGQWRDAASGAILHEPSKRVEIVLPGKADDEAQLDALVAAYKRMFHQQSVAVIVRPACVSF